MKTAFKKIFKFLLPNPIPGQFWFLDGIGLVEVISFTQTGWVYFKSNNVKRRTDYVTFKVSGYLIEKKYNNNQLVLDLNTPKDIQFNMKRILEGFEVLKNAA